MPALGIWDLELHWDLVLGIWDFTAPQDFRNSAICEHCVNNGPTSFRSIIVAASLFAFFGSGWHSKKIPSTPAATAARANSGEYCGFPPL